MLTHRWSAPDGSLVLDASVDLLLVNISSLLGNALVFNWASIADVARFHWLIGGRPARGNSQLMVVQPVCQLDVCLFVCLDAYQLLLLFAGECSGKTWSHVAG